VPPGVLIQDTFDLLGRGWTYRGQQAVPARPGPTILDMNNKLSAKCERARLSSRSSLLRMVIGWWARAQYKLDQVKRLRAAIRLVDHDRLPVPAGLSG
jgi:hypothetical protein